MIILAIETATEACSATLLISDEDNDSPRKSIRFQLAPREHTKLILPMLDDVIAEAGIELTDVDAVAFGRGPGAFTGLRIAAGIAQGVALSIDKPVVPVSTLHALAQSVKNEVSDSQSIVVALDARMNEVYWGEFAIKDKELEIVGNEQVMSTDDMLESLVGSDSGTGSTRQIVAIGNGWDTCTSTLPSNIRQISDKFPSAEHIAELAVGLFIGGKALPAEEAQPVYIRNNVAKKSQKKTT